MTAEEFDEAVERAVDEISEDVLRWTPAIIFKEFDERGVPPASLIAPLNSKLGQEYLAFLGRTGLIVKRAGL